MARPIKDGMDYFPHDTNAVNDEKIEALRSVYGNDGYAFYFILLERIYNSENGRLDISNRLRRSALISKVGVLEDKFNQLLDDALDVGLFDNDLYREKGVLTSNGIQKRFKEVEVQREKWRNKKVFQGEKGVDNPEITPQRKVKEIKVKEIKVKENKVKSTYAENVTMLPDEYQKLLKEHGESKTKRMIEILDNYKGANGKKYVSDYRAILTWVVKRDKEDQSKPPQKKSTKDNFEQREYTDEFLESLYFNVKDDKAEVPDG